MVSLFSKDSKKQGNKIRLEQYAINKVKEINFPSDEVPPKLEKAKKQREEANKVNSEAIKEAAELRQRVKVAQQEIQVAERVPPGTPLDPDMQQAIPLPIGPPTRTPLPHITR